MDTKLITQEPKQLPTEAMEALIRINILDSDEGQQMLDAARKKIKSPFNVPTPKEKIKKRPDGFDYVEGSYMDYQAKDTMPLYNYQLLHYSIDFGWASIIVSLTDSVTGNTELGAGAARIQVKRGTEAPNFRDVIDLGNNMKSALTQAIKNAQSRFGISADVYGKREELATLDEITRFEATKIKLLSISKSKATLFTEQWSHLGTGYTEFLDKWDIYISMNTEKSIKKRQTTENVSSTKGAKII